MTSLVWNEFSNALLVYQAYSRSNAKLKLWHRDFLFFILVLMYLNTVWFQQSTSRFNCIPNHLWWYTNTSCTNWPAALGLRQKLFALG